LSNDINSRGTGTERSSRSSSSSSSSSSTSSSRSPRGRQISKDRSQSKSPSKSKAETTKKENECPYCLKLLSSSQMLTLHLRIHTKDKPYKCPHCQMQFSRPIYYTNHLLLGRCESFTPLACSKCTKTFTSKTMLVEHRKNKKCQVSGGVRVK
jgi:uncharacterized Zn-finger protein